MWSHGSAKPSYPDDRSQGGQAPLVGNPPSPRDACRRLRCGVMARRSRAIPMTMRPLVLLVSADVNAVRELLTGPFVHRGRHHAFDVMLNQVPGDALGGEGDRGVT